MSGAELLIVIAVAGGPGLIALAIVKATGSRPKAVATDTPPAGWYGDPHRADIGWRWWDGSTWTDFTDEHHPSVTRNV